MYQPSAGTGGMAEDESLVTGGRERDIYLGSLIFSSSNARLNHMERSIAGLGPGEGTSVVLV